MASMKSSVFTKTYIKECCTGFDGKRHFYSDGSNGLVLSVDRRSDSTKYAFYFEGKLMGRSLRFKIGNFNFESNSAYSINEARARAIEATHLINSGVDPRTDKREKLKLISEERLLTSAVVVTLSEIWGAYLASRASDIRPLSSLTVRDYKKHIEKSFAHWATRPARAIDKESVLSQYTKFVEGIGAAQALQAMRSLSAVINWCMQSDKYGSIFIVNPVTALKKKTHRVKPRENCLEKSQLKSWWTACESIDNQVAKAYLKILLLTGARREEILSLRWSDVDFKWSKFTIQESKNGDKRTIPLTALSTKILSSLPRYNDWVFSSQKSRSGRLREPAKFIKNIYERTGLHISSHDLRRSFATLSEWAEIPDGAVKQLIGHRPNNVTELHYKRRPLDLLHSLLQKYEDFILREIQYLGHEAPVNLQIFG